MSYYEEKVLQLIDEDKEHFTSPEFCGLWGEDYDYKEIVRACYSLVEKGVLQKRNCNGLAFERKAMIQNEHKRTTE